MEGNAAKFKCRATGEPDPTIEWFKDDEPVETSKTLKASVIGDMYTLAISETTLEDEGEYKCVARNDVGSASTTAELLVNEEPARPEFKEKMKNIEVTAGEKARFEVQVTGYPEPKVEWFKGSDKLENQERFVTGKDEDYSFFLAVEDTMKEDNGSYKCVASNENGRATCRAELEVKDRLLAPEFVGDEDQSPISVCDGGELMLEVSVKGSPAPQVEWRKDDLSLTTTSRVSTLDNGDVHSLVVFPAKPSDSGPYKCTAKNKVGSATRTFKVVVEGMWLC